MSYLGELRANPRPLIAASLGSGTSLPLFAYTNSAFAPYLVREFGWSRSQFALVGLAMLSTILVLPVIGRLTDRFGVRPIATLGTILVPLCFVGYSAQWGSFPYFVAISVGVLAAGSLNGPLVYTRLIAETFERSTGLALTIVNCVPAILAIGMVPLLNQAIERFGWRAAYLGMGAFTLVCGVIALALLPRRAVGDGGRTIPLPAHGGDAETPGANLPDMPATPPLHAPRAGDYRLILRSRTFWIIMVAMFLCLLQTQLHASQMNLMLVDNGITLQAAANVVSVYAIGTIVGRIGCGLALDRLATPVVTCVSMILPALGLFLLATDWNAIGVISTAMLLIGLSVGAESDLMSFLIVRYFALRIYNTTLSMIYCTTFLASALGAVLISVTLRTANSFSPFLYLVSGAVFVGSLLFLTLPRSRDMRIG